MTPTYECNHVFSQLTNWCTTANNGTYFNMYKEEGGDYHVCFNKNNGSLYQMHSFSNQIKDSSDGELSRTTLKDMFKDDEAFGNALIEICKKENCNKMAIRLQRCMPANDKEITDDNFLQEFKDNFLQEKQDCFIEGDKVIVTIPKDEFIDVVSRLYDSSGRHALDEKYVEDALKEDGYIWDKATEWAFESAYYYDNLYSDVLKYDINPVLEKIGVPELNNIEIDMLNNKDIWDNGDNYNESQLHDILNLLDDDSSDETIRQIYVDSLSSAYFDEVKSHVLNAIEEVFPVVNLDLQLGQNEIDLTFDKEYIIDLISKLDVDNQIIDMDGYEVDISDKTYIDQYVGMKTDNFNDYGEGMFEIDGDMNFLDSVTPSNDYYDERISKIANKIAEIYKKG